MNMKLQAAACFIATAIGAAINVGGWMLVFSGPWRMGLWIVLLSAGILSVVLWDTGRD